MALKIRLMSFGKKEGTQISLRPIGEQRPKAVAAGGWKTHVLKVTVFPSKNTISWSGENKIYSDPKWCITPPPIDQQCTFYRKDAIYRCTQLPDCISVTCGDPAPFIADPKYMAAICHPRTSHTEDDKNAAVCIGNGERCQNIQLERMTVQEATAKMTMSRSSVVSLQLLDEVEDGDIVLDYTPGEEWFEGAMERAKDSEGWQHVKFRTPNDYVKIAGKEFMFLRHA
jgi:hypothetical protein